MVFKIISDYPDAFGLVHIYRDLLFILFLCKWLKSESSWIVHLLCISAMCGCQGAEYVDDYKKQQLYDWMKTCHWPTCNSLAIPWTMNALWRRWKQYIILSPWLYPHIENIWVLVGTCCHLQPRRNDTAFTLLLCYFSGINKNHSYSIEHISLVVLIVGDIRPHRR